MPRWEPSMSCDAPLAKPARMLAALLLAAGMAGCAETEKSSGEPSFYRSMAKADVELDAQVAASMISGYRQNNGLGPVALDPELTKIADEQARAMASRDRLDRNAAGALPERIRRARFDAKVAAENISAGYHTLAEAFSGWRDSPPHRKNMLLQGATRMGIAAVYAPNSKYKVYWSLILAAPEERRG
jgi:uncharacterized protein YkwD